MEQNIEQQVTRGGINPTALPKSFPFATEIISLPSEGLCYPETHPLSKGTIEIKLLIYKYRTSYPKFLLEKLVMSLQDITQKSIIGT